MIAWFFCRRYFPTRPSRNHPQRRTMTEIPSFGIAVVERVPYWVPEIQRRLASQSRPHDWIVRRCAAPRDLGALAAEASAFALIVDSGIPSQEILQWLQRVRPMLPRLVGLVLPPALAELEWVFREAGATDLWVRHPGGDEVYRSLERTATAHDTGREAGRRRA